MAISNARLRPVKRDSISRPPPPGLAPSNFATLEQYINIVSSELALTEPDLHLTQHRLLLTPKPHIQDRRDLRARIVSSPPDRRDGEHRRLDKTSDAVPVS